MITKSIRLLTKIALNSKIWRPSSTDLVLRHLIHKNLNKQSGFTDREHLLAAVEWLERAQDITGNGGVSGRYLLGHGWSSSYPETTGYIIPTFLALSKKLKRETHCKPQG